LAIQTIPHNVGFKRTRRGLSSTRLPNARTWSSIIYSETSKIPEGVFSSLTPNTNYPVVLAALPLSCGRIHVKLVP
jgi:hypothetical protein